MSGAAVSRGRGIDRRATHDHLDRGLGGRAADGRAGCRAAAGRRGAGRTAGQREDGNGQDRHGDAIHARTLPAPGHQVCLGDRMVTWRSTRALLGVAARLICRLALWARRLARPLFRGPAIVATGRRRHVASGSSAQSGPLRALYRMEDSTSARRQTLPEGRRASGAEACIHRSDAHGTSMPRLRPPRIG
jgi:hypothetical protein